MVNATNTRKGGMDINDAEKFVNAWACGNEAAMAESIEMVEKFLCRDGVTAQQREAVLSFIEAKIRAGWTL
jgi:hypothetical protein